MADKITTCSGSNTQGPIRYVTFEPSFRTLHPDKKTVKNQLFYLKNWLLRDNSTIPETPQWRTLKEVHRNALVATSLRITEREK